MNKTPLVIIVVAAALILWDLRLALDATPGNTISEVVWRASKHPLVPFLAGFLCGHLFWQVKV